MMPTHVQIELTSSVVAEMKDCVLWLESSSNETELMGSMMPRSASSGNEYANFRLGKAERFNNLKQQINALLPKHVKIH